MVHLRSLTMAKIGMKPRFYTTKVHVLSNTSCCFRRNPKHNRKSGQCAVHTLCAANQDISYPSQLLKMSSTRIKTSQVRWGISLNHWLQDKPFPSSWGEIVANFHAVKKDTNSYWIRVLSEFFVFFSNGSKFLHLFHPMISTSAELSIINPLVYLKLPHRY